MNELIKQALVTLGTIVISMTGFWMMLGRDLPTRAEVDGQIEDKLSVVKSDIKAINTKLDDKIVTDAKNSEKLAKIIEDNSKVLGEVKVSMAALAKSIEYLEKSIDAKTK